MQFNSEAKFLSMKQWFRKRKNEIDFNFLKKIKINLIFPFPKPFHHFN